MQKRLRLKKAAVWTGTVGLVVETAGALLYFGGDILPSLKQYNTQPYAQAAFISGGILIGSSIMSLLGLGLSGD